AIPFRLFAYATLCRSGGGFGGAVLRAGGQGKGGKSKDQCMTSIHGNILMFCVGRSLGLGTQTVHRRFGSRTFALKPHKSATTQRSEEHTSELQSRENL